jgi:hypothetical protein
MNRAIGDFEVLICPDVVSKEKREGYKEKVLVDGVIEAEVGRVKDQQARFVPGRNAGRDAAAPGATIEHNFIFRVGLREPFVNMLCVTEHDGLCSLSMTLTKAPVVDHQKIISIAQKILGEFSPPFDALGVSLEVIYHAAGIGYAKVDRVNTTAIFHVEVQFLKGERVLVLKGPGEFFGPEENQVLKEVE